VGGRLAAAGFVLLGLLPFLALVGNLAGRFDAGLGVWHDLVLMLADGQIGATLALLSCVLAGSGVAIVAVAGRGPAGPAPEIPIEGAGEISVRRQSNTPDDGPADEAEPDEPERETSPEPEPQPEPERDPRLWSKPLGWISPPPGRRSATPRPSAT
jgi:hypothetical protein